MSPVWDLVYASADLITSPLTSVKRMLRPAYLYVNRVSNSHLESENK